MKKLTPTQVRSFAAYQAQDISLGISQHADILADSLESGEISQSEAEEWFAELQEQLEEARCE